MKCFASFLFLLFTFAMVQSEVLSVSTDSSGDGGIVGGFPSGNSLPTFTTDAIGAWGVETVVKGYMGPWFRLKRDSDNVEVDIYSVEDVATHFGSIPSWYSAPELGEITIYYDQSGNGYDLTPEEGAHVPMLALDGKLRTRPKRPFGHVSYTNTAMPISSNKDISLYAMTEGQDRSIHEDGPNILYWQLGLEGDADAIFYSSGFGAENQGRRVNAAIGGQYRNIGDPESYYPPNVSFEPYSWTITDADFRYKAGEVVDISTTTGALRRDLTGIRLFACLDTKFRSKTSFRAAYILPYAHTPAEEVAALRGMAVSFGGSIGVTDNVVHIGDSIIAGYNKSGNADFRETSPLALVKQLLGASYWCINRGRSGGTIAASGGNLEKVYNQFGVEIDGMIRSDLRNTLICSLGTNDLTLGATAAETWAALDSYLSARQAAGWTVIITNIIPRQAMSVSQETERLALNALMAANYTDCADFFVDMDAEVDWTDSSYTTYYQDGTHPNAAGVSVFAKAIARIVTGGIN